MNDVLKNCVVKVLNEEIIGFVEIDGGLVHKIFRLETKSGKKFILKQRLNQYSKLPKLHPDYKRIVYEKKALEIMHNLGLKQYFPRLFGYVSDLNFILMEDVLKEKSFVCDNVNLSNDICVKIINSISNIHTKLKDFTDSIHIDRDRRIYNLNIRYRILNHSRNLAPVNRVVRIMRKLNRNIILGDVCPKNIIVNDKNVFFFDLEYCHRGNFEFEIAYLLAHLIIQGVGDMKVDRIFDYYLELYFKNVSFKFRYEIVLILSISILLYRLDNQIIPYKTKFKIAQKKNIVTRIRKILTEKRDYTDSKILLKIMYGS